MKTTTLMAAALLLGGTAPALAQMPPGGPPGSPHGRMFASMSEAGRATMIEAMRAADPRADKGMTAGARDRMLAILDADRLDVAALRQAMDAEREAANAARVRHQTAMLAGFQKLSLADRKAFVADARAMRARMEGRMGQWKRGDKRPPMPPPPPM